MTQEGQDWTLRRGRRRTLRFLVRDEDEAAVSEVGVTASWVLSSGIGHDAILSKPGVVDQDPVAQTLRVTVEITNDDTVDLAPGRYVHELGVVDGTGARFVAAVGTLTLKETNILPGAS